MALRADAPGIMIATVATPAAGVVNCLGNDFPLLLAVIQAFSPCPHATIGRTLPPVDGLLYGPLVRHTDTHLITQQLIHTAKVI